MKKDEVMEKYVVGLSEEELEVFQRLVEIRRRRGKDWTEWRAALEYAKENSPNAYQAYWAFSEEVYEAI